MTVQLISLPCPADGAAYIGVGGRQQLTQSKPAAHLRLPARAFDDDGVDDDVAAGGAQAAQHQQPHRHRHGVRQQRQARPCGRPCCSPTFGSSEWVSGKSPSGRRMAYNELVGLSKGLDLKWG